MAKVKYRSIFISDVHLGTKDSQADYLLDFLKNTESDYLYLIGDIFDIWKMKSGWHWPQINSNIVQNILYKAKTGTQVVYIPGNHDERLRDYVGTMFYGVAIAGDHHHDTADGKRLLLIHGDEFDGLVMTNPWLVRLGDWSYIACLWLNRQFNRFRKQFGFPYWSLSRYLKCRMKNAMEHISRYVNACISETRRRGYDGVVCGHIHHADIKSIDGILYCNTGDWVENCTALTEDRQGRLSIIRWVEESTRLMSESDVDGIGIPEVEAIARKAA